MNILYISPGYFPSGTAYATRILNISKILLGLGHEVHVLVDQTKNNNLLNDEGNGLIEGVTFEVNDQSKQNRISRIFLPKKCYIKTELLIRNNDFDLVIMGSAFDRFAKIHQLLSDHKIPVILESCEWFDVSNWKFGRFNPNYHQFLKSFNKHFIKVDGVIAISKLLEERYEKYVNNVIRIPAIMDTNEIVYNVNKTNKNIKLMYAGNPGKSKELLLPIFEALKILGDKGKNIELSIFGVEIGDLRKQSIEVSDDLDTIKAKINFYGNVDQDLIYEHYRNHDFGIFLRPYRRSSNAGFPTKFVEALASGTPVICNDTGDISDYLKSGLNGFLLSDNDAQTLANLLLDIQDKNTDFFNTMRKNARRTAEDYFDIKVHSRILSDLINSI